MDQGFQRFLEVLNRGVDVNLLRRIVNDDPEDAGGPQRDPGSSSSSSSPRGSRSRRSDGERSLPEHGGSGERSRDAPSREGPGSNRRPDGEEHGEEALSPLRSKPSSDPPAGIGRQKAGEVRAKHEQQHEQLQNILTSLGLQLEVEEISKLANRTQERLYGKKAEGVNAESRREPDGRARRSPSSDRSSSSSSGSSSRSGSSRSRRASESAGSRGRSGGENSRGGEKRPEVGGQDQPRLGDQHSCACPPPIPGCSFPLLGVDGVAQYCQYSAYGANPYQAAAASCWTYAQAPACPSSYPGSGPYAQDRRPPFLIAVPEQTRDLPRQAPPLSQRCLKAVRRNRATDGAKEWRAPLKRTKRLSAKNLVCCEQNRTKDKRKRAEEKAEGDRRPAPGKEGRANQVKALVLLFPDCFYSLLLQPALPLELVLGTCLEFWIRFPAS